MKQAGVILGSLAIAGCDYLLDVGGGALEAEIELPLPELPLYDVSTRLMAAAFTDERVAELLERHGLPSHQLLGSEQRTVLLARPFELAGLYGVSEQELAEDLRSLINDGLAEVTTSMNREISERLPRGIEANVAIRTPLVSLARWRDGEPVGFPEELFWVDIDLAVDDFDAVEFPEDIHLSREAVSTFLASLRLFAVTVSDPKSCAPVAFIRMLRVSMHHQAADGGNRVVSSIASTSSCALSVAMQTSNLVTAVDYPFSLHLEFLVEGEQPEAALTGEAALEITTRPGPLLSTVFRAIEHFER